MVQDGVPLEHLLALEIYGVRAAIRADSVEVLRHVEALLPPGWVPVEQTEDAAELTIGTQGGASFTVEVDGVRVVVGAELDVAVGVLDARLRAHVALTAPELIFVHAGVVAYHGRAIVIPGPSFSGKTSLVAALVQAGAEYCSDEYAVLDRGGRVHPYAKPLSIRGEDLVQTDTDVSAYGRRASPIGLPIGLIAAAQYRPGARWHPVRLTAGGGALALLANAIAVQERSEEVLEVVTKAANGAVAVEGERGDATSIVEELLAMLPEAGAGPTRTEPDKAEEPRISTAPQGSGPWSS